MIGNKVHKYVFMVVAVFCAFVSTASATIESDLANFSLIIGNSSSGLTGFMVSMMTVFMQPPLVYFVTIGIFVMIIGIVAGLVMRRGRRGRR